MLHVKSGLIESKRDAGLMLKCAWKVLDCELTYYVSFTRAEEYRKGFYQRHFLCMHVFCYLCSTAGDDMVIQNYSREARSLSTVSAANCRNTA